MSSNRISEFGEPLPKPQPSACIPPPCSSSPPVLQVLQPLSLAGLYAAAYEKAVRDHELDKLFNPDYYNYNI